VSTVRTAIKEAMRLLKALAPGDDPTVDELAVGLEAAQALVLEIHEARGPMRDVDVPGGNWPGCGGNGGASGVFDAPPPGTGTVALCPGDNQRLRIQANYSASVTLPNSVSIFGTYDPYDYGFAPSARWNPQVGSTAPADGVYWRAPTDGARIEIVGTTQALYFYRSDTNVWAPALGLTLETELPFSARLQNHFATMLGERLADVLANLPEPTKAQVARVAHAREAMFSRPGTHRAPVRGQYL
jgi:hypothetical protein